jgi:hypothetical protein
LDWISAASHLVTNQIEKKIPLSTVDNATRALNEPAVAVVKPETKVAAPRG